MGRAEDELNAGDRDLVCGRSALLDLPVLSSLGGGSMVYWWGWTLERWDFGSCRKSGSRVIGDL